MTRASAKELKDNVYGLKEGTITFMENFMRNGLWSKMEGLKDDSIAQKMFMGIVTTKGHQLEQVGELKVGKRVKIESSRLRSSGTSGRDMLLSMGGKEVKA